MKPDTRFLKQPMSFWAHVRSISEEVGYTVRARHSIKVPKLKEIRAALKRLQLKTAHVTPDGVEPTRFGAILLDYFRYRADVLNTFVEPSLMDAKEAERLFDKLCSQHHPDDCDIPWNKQKGRPGDR